MGELDPKAGLKKEWELSKRKREERHSRQREQYMQRRGRKDQGLSRS